MHKTRGVIKKWMQAPEEPFRLDSTSSTAAAVRFGHDHGQLLPNSRSRNNLHSSIFHCFAVVQETCFNFVHGTFLSLVSSLSILVRSFFPARRALPAAKKDMPAREPNSVCMCVHV